MDTVKMLDTVSVCSQRCLQLKCICHQSLGIIQKLKNKDISLIKLWYFIFNLPETQVTCYILVNIIHLILFRYMYFVPLLAP